MELEEDIVRIQVCQKCHEHNKVDSHSQLHYYNAFQSCKKIFNQHGFKVLKNIPYKYLTKAPDTKVSSKRFFDRNTHKIQQFPRKGSFEIYYMCILIFSKLQQAQFPQPTFVFEIIKKIKKSYKVNPLLEAYQSFRNIEIDRKKNQKYLRSFHQYIKVQCSKNSQKQELDLFFIKFQNQRNLQKDRKKVIYPYSYYANKQKKCKIEKIYCPSLIKKCKKGNKSLKNMTFKQSFNKTRSPTQTQVRKLTNFNKNQLFDMVRLGGQKIIDQKKIKSFQKQDLKNIRNSNNMNLYVSYLKQLKRGKSCKRQVKNKTGRLQSAFLKPNLTQFIQGNVKISAKQLKKCTSRSSNNNIQKLFEKNDQLQQDKNTEISIIPLKSQCIKTQKEQQIYKKTEIQSLVKQEMMNIIDNLEWGQQQTKKSQIQMNTQQDKQFFGQHHSIEQSKRSLYSQKFTTQNIDQLWQINKLQSHIKYQQANIKKKFSQYQNFKCYNFQNIYQVEDTELSDFNIQGSQLSNNFYIQSIRKYYKPGQLKLFPVVFEYIQEKSRLACVVNLLLQQNPILITRLFENKKFINPYGIYSIWLKNKVGIFQQIIINDKFAFSKANNQFIYSKPINKNSIWFMLLQKAFAKLLGQYYKIQQTPLSQILSIILNCPKVQFKNLYPEKIVKILNQKIFYNRLAYLFSISTNKFKQYDDINKKIKRVTNFKQVKDQIKQSLLTLQAGQEKQTINVKQFLISYNFISLIFFNSSFYFNQSKLPNAKNSKSITCEIKSKNSRNDCYLIFTNFPAQCLTKVSIFKKLTDEEVNISEGMNPIEQDQKRYEYVGEIQKKENFFFQTQLDIGQYICIFQGKYENEENMHMSIYSQKQIYIGQIKTHRNMITNKRQSESFYLKQNKILLKEKRKNKLGCSEILIQKSLIKYETPSKHKRFKKNFDDVKVHKKFFLSDDQSDNFFDKENFIN